MEPQYMKRLQGIALLVACCIALGAKPCDAQLGSLAEIRQTAVHQNASFDADFQATVTYVDPVWNFLFVSDGKEAVFVQGDRPGDAVKPGERVRIVGELVAGDLKPFIRASSVEVLGLGEMPSPFRVDLSTMELGDEDCEFVETELEVRQALVSGLATVFYGYSGDTAVFVNIGEGGIEYREAARFVGHRVKCTGALGVHVKTYAFAEPGQEQARLDTFRVYCSSLQDVHIVEHDQGHSHKMERADRSTIGDLLRATGEGQFHTHGQISLVNHTEGDRYIVLFDERNAVRVELESAADMHSGMIARVVGTRTLQNGKVQFRADVVEHEGFAPMRRRRPRTVTETTSDFDYYQLCSVEGEPVKLVREADAVILTLGDRSSQMRVRLYGDVTEPETLESIKPGHAKLVRLSGVCMPCDESLGTPFELVVSRTEDVEMLERTFLSMRLALIGLGACLTAFLLAMLWVRTLHVRVAEKTADAVSMTAQLRSSYDAIDLGVLAIDRDQKALAVNNEFRRLTRSGHRAGDFMGHLRELLAKRVIQKEQLEDFWQTIESHPDASHSAEFDFEGSEPWRVVMRTAPIKVDDRQQPIGRLFVLRDETEKRRLQTELLHSNKLEAVGRMVGGVAHDFNNVLMAVAANLTIAQFDESVPVGSVRHELSVAEDAAYRGADIVRRLLNFSGKQELELQPQRINEVVNRLGDLVRHTFDASIRFDFRLDPSDPVVMVDSTAIEQVLLNLYVNARDAMPDGGCITTQTTVVENSATLEKVVMVSVEDNGLGVPAGVRDRIFDPFFTTKDSNHGSGLGLSVSYGVLQQHGGTLQYKNNPHGGSLFQLVLPLHCVADRTAPPVDSPLPRGRERILVVDDEDVVRAVASTMLRKQGFKPVGAPDGASALETLQREQGQFDCVLLDLTMPGIPGREVLDTIKREWPRMPVILCSGYLGGELVAAGLHGPADAEIPKPYSMKQLLTTLDEVLTASGVRQPEPGDSVRSA